LAKSKVTSSLSRLVLEAARPETSSSDQVDIITFVESSWGLNMRLWPVQKVILKAHYGIALDDNPHRKFEISDWKDDHRQSFTEAEYLEYLYEEGRCNISKVVEGVQRRNLILPIGRRSGKCVTGDTLVLSSCGILPIDELGDPEGEELQTTHFRVAQESGDRADSAFFYNGGVRDTIRLTTSLGSEIEGTPNHRIRVKKHNGDNVWKRLDEITSKDRVVVNVRTEMWNDAPLSSAEESAQVDSALYEAARICSCVSTDDPKWKASQIKIPSSILRSSRRAICCFLYKFLSRMGAFSPDGPSALLDCSSSRVLREVQTLLLNIGFIVTVLHPTAPGRHTSLSFRSLEDRALLKKCLLMGWCSGLRNDLPCFEEWAEVASISSSKGRVYDLNVPEGSHFIANGLTNHNTTISACIVAYETYCLINKDNPQSYYGVAPSNPIRLISVATGKDQAGLLYAEASSHFAKCHFFRRYTANNTMSYARFQSPSDIREFGDYASNPKARASLQVSFAACNAKSLRGAGNTCNYSR